MKNASDIDRIGWQRATGNNAFDNEQFVTVTTMPSIKPVLYPNPSDGLYFLHMRQTNGKNFSIQIRNDLGQLLQIISKQPTGTLEEIKIDISASVYPAGVYFLQLNNGTASYIYKLINQ